MTYLYPASELARRNVRSLRDSPDLVRDRDWRNLIVLHLNLTAGHYLTEEDQAWVSEIRGRIAVERQGRVCCVG